MERHKPRQPAGQPLLILEVLLANDCKLATRNEIRETLWPGDTFVDFEHGHNTSVRWLRTVLGDSARQPSYIETVRKSGYRFIASVDIEVTEDTQAIITAVEQAPSADDAKADGSDSRSDLRPFAKDEYTNLQ